MPNSLQLAHEWAQIRETGKGDGVLEVPSRPVDVSTGHGQVRLATGPSGEPRLLIPVARPGSKRVPAGNNCLMLGYASYRGSGRGEHFIDLMLKEERLAGVFSDLAEEILGRILSGEGPETAVQGTIEDFRKLLAVSTTAEVDFSDLVGLVGELLLLERLCQLNSDVVSAWTGPLSQRHDFRRGAIAIETKTSTRADAVRVQIHGHEQLEAPLGAELYLAHVRIEQTDRGALTISTLRRKIIEHNADPVLLDRRLLAAGCREPDGDAWNDRAFALEGLEFYHVNDGFPRIVSSSLAGQAFPIGVGDLKYSIDLSSARDHRLDAAIALDIMRSFAE